MSWHTGNCWARRIDAVIIATYWQWHAPMAVDAMKAGKYVELSSGGVNL